ncbi:MAG: CCA tRNA nucleotidyltransferase [Proteobacteria bacterium]|nr:CCA tRNA nucleotidyltransferase [Pseudomonadota bacterium]
MIRIPAAFQPLVGPIVEESRRRAWDVYVVGGPVRDWILKRPTKDLDLLVGGDAAPLAEWCRKRWGGELQAFGQFGTLRLIGAEGGLRLDFVRARAESYPAPGALPVTRPGTLLEDLYRRDFALNAMAARPLSDSEAELVDPYDGARDLEAGVLRVLHPKSFIDDPTRLFRAARFSARFGMRLEPRTESLRKEAERERAVQRLSRERLRGELWRFLEERDPAPGLARLKAWDLARHFHEHFAWPDLGAADAPAARLGLIALEMEKDGPAFVASLHLERPVSQAILEACKVWSEQACARSPLPPLAADVLRAYGGKRLAPAATAPLLVNGADLKTLGHASGPEFKAILERAARAQWKGEFSTRPQALRWLAGTASAK